MYKSPIEMILGELRLQQEGEIFRAVQDYNISVDKEELLKALQYDRGQYEKGFRDGVRSVGAEILKEKYEELREAFVDYVCSGVPNPAPYCKNRCEGCVDQRGWCKTYDGACRGFNPDGERRTE